MLQTLRDKVTVALEDDSSCLWGLAFVGVCVLVGLGKLKPETLEFMLFALIGRSGSKKPQDSVLPQEGK